MGSSLCSGVSPKEIGSIGGSVGGRYAVMPVAILTLMAIYGASVASGRAIRIASSALLVSSLLWGLAAFWTEAPKSLRCIDCPEWRDEVARWQAGETRELRIWPYDRKTEWLVKLPGVVTPR